MNSEYLLTPKTSSRNTFKSLASVLAISLAVSVAVVSVNNSYSLKSEPAATTSLSTGAYQLSPYPYEGIKYRARDLYS